MTDEVSATADARITALETKVEQLRSLVIVVAKLCYSALRKELDDKFWDHEES